MKKLKLILLLLLCLIINLYSQEKRQAVKTSQTGGRYEIVQSEIFRNQTFKLDKYTGKVLQLVNTLYDRVLWQDVPKNTSNPDIVLPDKINYQLFLGGMFARDCFLLNINTGTTWLLVKDSVDNVSFEYFE